MSDPGPTVFNGRYELHRPIGRGGMAEVFLGRDQLLDRPVAVKVLFTEFASDPAFVQRFRREATAAANLNHPNIVAVYDWGETEGTYFIVMEYVDGRSLSEILRAEGPLHPDRVADVGADVAAALGFAHRSGVVHRDVKPGNVLVTQTGQVKVADFGIARAIEASPDDNLTQVGQVMGTATYFSPEQARGDAVDPRSDIYSLGCVLYELSVGRPPFSGDTPVAIAYKHVHETPEAPRQLDPAVPAALEAIILKCLAKNPVNRYPSAEDLRADLRRFREGDQIVAEPVMAVPVDPGATTAVAAVEGTRAIPVYADDVTEDEEEDKKSSRPFIISLLLLLLALAGLLFLLARVLGVGDDDTKIGEVAVPYVVGMPIGEAQDLLDSKDLKYEVTQEANEDQPAGNVFAQDPPRGEKVDKGSVVKLKVSSGAEAIPVPRVVGSQVDQARLLLTSQGFTNIAEEPTPDETAPVGEVVDQDPAEGQEVAKDTKITLFVSSGPADRPVPDVVGRPIAEASNLLGQAGFTVKEVSQASDSVDAGIVISTNPPKNAVAKKGSEVTVVVSSGPAQATVPSVVGLLEANAANTLTSKGFNPVVEQQDTSDSSQDGRVISQNPAGNSTAKAGSDVTITVGHYVAPSTTTTTT